MNLDPRRLRSSSEAAVDRSDPAPGDEPGLDGRRGFLVAAAALPALAIGASLLPATILAPDAAAADDVSPEIAFLEFAVSLELALVSLYGTAVAAGKLGGDATAAANACLDHHNAHAKALGTLITAGGGTAPPAGNVGLIDAFGPQISAAADEPALATLLRTLEGAMAATYFESYDIVTSTAIAASIATVLPVEGEHAVLWSAAGAETPGQPSQEVVPETQTATGALSPSTYEITSPTTTAPATTATNGAPS